jgi:hypothetical protein
MSNPIQAFIEERKQRIALNKNWAKLLPCRKRCSMCRDVESEQLPVFVEFFMDGAPHHSNTAGK